MNTQTVLMSLASTASGIQFIPIAMANENNEIILMAQNTFTLEGTAITLGETFFSQSNISTFAPFTLILNPSSLDIESKIYRIEYLFGDGNVVTQNYYYSNTSLDTMMLPYSADPGDPRNYPQQQTFFLDKPETRYLSVEVRIYQFGFLEYKNYFVNLELNPPSLDGELNGYFKNLHLISTRMFGPDDKIFYIFESESPNYILPAMIKWERKPAQQTQITIQDNLNRPYKLLQGFEREEVTPVNTNVPISFVTPASSNSIVTDVGIELFI